MCELNSTIKGDIESSCENKSNVSKNNNNTKNKSYLA